MCQAFDRRDDVFGEGGWGRVGVFAMRCLDCVVRLLVVSAAFVLSARTVFVRLRSDVCFLSVVSLLRGMV